MSTARTEIVTVASELTGLAERLGVLTPASVVDYARDPESPLHTHFEWDDREAGEKFRLLQAAVMIRQCRVRLITHESETKPVRAFVSLPSDRVAGAGYRKIETVLQRPQWRSELLAVALAELGTFRRKYEHLTELSEVFAGIDRLAAESD